MNTDGDGARCQMQELAVWKFHDRPQLRSAQERGYTTLPSARSGQRVTAPAGSAVATLFVAFPGHYRKWRAGFVGGSVGKRGGGLEMQGKSREQSGRPIRRNAEDPAKLHPHDQELARDHLQRLGDVILFLPHGATAGASSRSRYAA